MSIAFVTSRGAVKSRCARRLWALGLGVALAFGATEGVEAKKKIAERPNEVAKAQPAQADGAKRGHPGERSAARTVGEGKAASQATDKPEKAGTAGAEKKKTGTPAAQAEGGSAAEKSDKAKGKQSLSQGDKKQGKEPAADPVKKDSQKKAGGDEAQSAGSTSEGSKKGKKKEKADKSDKSDKSEKSKADKPEKEKKGLFGFGRKGKEDKEEAADKHSEEKAEQAAPEKEPAEPQAKAEPAGSGAQPVRQVPEVAPLLPDSALISILKDLARALKDSEEAAKIEDADQKAALELAAAGLANALESGDLKPNRILPQPDKERLQAMMTTEAWASGDIVISPDCHASVSAVWAKKVDGIVNVAVAGNCGCKASPSGRKVGEFLAVLTGKSAVDAGFDIQSQQDVNFWLGKLTGVAVEASRCGDAQAAAESASAVADATDKEQKATLVLQALLTERGRKHLNELKAAEELKRQLALKADKERQAAEEKARQEAAAAEEEKAKAAQEEKAQAGESAGAEGKAGAQATGAEAGSKTGTQEVAATTGGAPPARLAGGAAKMLPEGVRVPPAVVEDPRTGAVKPVVPAPGAYLPTQTYPSSGGSYAGGEVAMAGQMPDLARQGSQGGWDSPPPPPATRVPSAAAQVVLPDKALAGQFLTAAVLNPNHAAEPSVELSFNGAALATGSDGKALYLVPEDALPGPSLHVSLVARPEANPAVINVLQPLSTPAGPQIPRIDQVSPLVQAGGTMVINGHDFDGVANRNSVTIDGMYDARVLVSSPVQLKADLPLNLLAGPHTVSVSAGALRSNPVQFEVFTVEVVPAVKESGKEILKKLVVRVNGTRSPIRLRLRNHTPDVLRINKGNDIEIVTPGGPNNVVVLDVQRLRPGSYHIEAKMD